MLSSSTRAYAVTNFIYYIFYFLIYQFIKLPCLIRPEVDSNQMAAHALVSLRNSYLFAYFWLRRGHLSLLFTTINLVLLSWENSVQSSAGYQLTCHLSYLHCVGFVGLRIADRMSICSARLWNIWSCVLIVLLFLRVVYYCAHVLTCGIVFIIIFFSCLTCVWNWAMPFLCSTGTLTLVTVQVPHHCMM